MFDYDFSTHGSVSCESFEAFQKAKEDNEADAQQLVRVEIAKEKSYLAKVAQLQASDPSLIVVHGIHQLGDYLQCCQFSKTSICRALNICQPLWNQFFCKDLRHILVTKTVREAYPEVFDKLSYPDRNAKYLFDFEDIFEWTKKYFEVSVETVLVPLSMLATNPEGMRAAFRRVKNAKLGKAFSSSTRAELNANRISEWAEVMKYVKPEFRSLCGSYSEDSQKYKNPSTGRTSFPRIVVPFPKDKFPFLHSQSDLSQIVGYGYSPQVAFRAVRNRGWARFTLNEAGRKLYCERLGKDWAESQKKAEHFWFTKYAPGLRLGGIESFEDYELGMVELVTAKRFVEIFGPQALQNADWLWRPEDCAWFKDNAVFGPKIPVKTLSATLGSNYIAPKARGMSV